MYQFEIRALPVGVPPADPGDYRGLRSNDGQRYDFSVTILDRGLFGRDQATAGECFRDRELWGKLMERRWRENFSWAAAAPATNSFTASLPRERRSRSVDVDLGARE